MAVYYQGRTLFLLSTFLTSSLLVAAPSCATAEQKEASSPSVSQWEPEIPTWFDDRTERPSFTPAVKNLQRSTSARIRDISLSPDGRLLSLMEEDKEAEEKGFAVSVWDVSAGTLIRTLRPFEEYQQDAHHAFSMSGKHLLAWDYKRVVIYDSRGENELLRVTPSDGIKAAAVSPDDSRLLIGLSDDAIELWDIAGRRKLRKIDGLGDAPRRIFFAHAKPICGFFADGQVHLIDWLSGKQLMRMEAQGGFGGLSPDGTTLAVAREWETEAIRLSEDATRVTARKTFEADARGGQALAFLTHQPNSVLLIGDSDFSLLSLDEVKRLDQPYIDGEWDPKHVKLGAVAAETGMLATVIDGRLRLYTPDWRRQVLAVSCVIGEDRQRVRLRRLRLSADGAIAAMLDDEGKTITLVDIASTLKSARSKAEELITLHAGEASELLGKSRKELVAAADRMQAENRVSQSLAAPLPDKCEPISGRTLAESASTLILQCEQGKSHGLAVASPVTGERISTIPLQDPEERDDRYDAAFAADDGSVVGTIADGRVTLWSAVSGRALHSFRAVRTDVGSACGPLLGPGGAWVAAAAYGDIVTVRHGVTGSEKFILKREGSEADIEHMASTPDGTLLGVLYSDNTLIAWSMQSGTPLWSAPDVPNERGAPIFSSTGSLVAAIADSQVLGWNTVDGSRVFALPTDRPASGVAFASDDNTVYVLAKDGLVTAYHVKSSEKLWARKVAGVAYSREVNFGVSPDGRFLILTNDTGVSLYLLDDLRDAAPKDVVVEAKHCLSIPGERSLMGFGGPDSSCLLVVQQRSDSEIARTLIHLEGLHAQNAAAKANRAPPGDAAADLNAAITASGGDAADYFWYGSKAIADKARAGDRFDKEDAEKEAAGHRKKLETQTLFFSMDYEWQEKAKATGDGIVISVKLPMRCDFEADAVVKARECQMQYWMLLDDGSIRLCRNEADILNNRARIYFPEDAKNTELLIYIEAPREVLKAIARKTSAFEVIAHLRHIQTTPRKTQGFYRADAVQLWGDCSAVRRRGEAADPDGLPDYFTTTLDAADGVIVKATLSKLEVVQTDSPERKVVFSWPPAEE